MTRATPRQTQFFYSALRGIALDGVLPRDHLLRRCPLDPLERGQTRSERRAVRSLHLPRVTGRVICADCGTAMS